MEFKPYMATSHIPISIGIGHESHGIHETFREVSASVYIACEFQ